MPAAATTTTVTVDPVLKDVGKKEGIDVWRINKFNLEVVPKNQHGIFYEGDTYIVLHTKYGAAAWDVHFWLGNKATIDEVGTAAIKTIEIDQTLGGLPTQYREVQGHESPTFLSYFKNGIRCPSGGHETGFRTVKDMLANFKPRLYQCKGKRNVRCTEVAMKKESLNLGDVFLLDKGKEIFVWMPPESGRLERIKGMTRAKDIADLERPGECKVHILDDTWDKNADFWKVFGGKEVIKSIAKAKNDDENYWERHKDQVSLWKISDAAGGKPSVKKIAQGEGVKQSLLDSSDAFVLDAVNGGVFVWVGKNCTTEERAKALQWGKAYLEQAKLPPWICVTRVLETTEPQLFSQWFSNWKGAAKINSFQPRLFQCSDESGKLKVEEIVAFDQESLDGDDVMILDAAGTIFVWIGGNANAEEKKHAQKTAEDYLKNGQVKRDSRIAKPSIDTVFQGKESTTFKKFFPKWDDNLFKKDRSAAMMRKQLFK